MRLLLAFVALGLSLTMGSVAHSAPEATTATDADQKVACKHRRKTGTRFTTKICKTVAQWEEMVELNRAALKEMVDRPQIKGCGPSGCD